MVVEQAPSLFVRFRRPMFNWPAFSRGCVVLLFAMAPLAAAHSAAGDTQARIDEGAVAMSRGNTTQAVTAYTEALKDTALSNDRRAVLLNDRAVAHVRLGQTRLAFDDFNRAAQLFPENAAIYNNRGNLLLALGLSKEALKDFDRAIVLAPGYVAAYNNRAGTHVKLGSQADAIRDFTKAIELAPQSPAPLSGRGRAHLALGRPHAAARDFTRAAAADARFAPAYRNRAEAKLETGQIDDAIADFSRAIAFDANNLEIFILRGYAYLCSENTASAIKDFSRAIELDPTSPLGYRWRGLAHGIAEAFDDAYADLNKAIELDPRSAVAFAYRAQVYKLNGQIEIGFKDIQAAMKLDPGLAEVHWAKGELEEAAGRKEQAIEDMRRAVSLKPALFEANKGLERLGASLDSNEDRIVSGAGVDTWRVVARGHNHFAVSTEYPKLRVPLEMGGEGTPRLLEWESKKPPLKGIGVLRFYGGATAGPSGPEDVEMVAIIDVTSNTVVGIQPHRQGFKVATWTWDEGKVTIASVDGVTDEFLLRVVRPKDAGPPLAGSVAQRRYTSNEQKGAGWSPWSDSYGLADPGRGDRRPSAQQRPQQQKPKTLFDLLFKY